MVKDAKNGQTLLEIAEIADDIGFRTNGVSLDLSDLRNQQFPCIVHWEQKHFVVVYKITATKVYISDPGPGLLISYTHNEFEEKWASKDENKNHGFSLLLTPTEKLQLLKKQQSKRKWVFLKEMYFVPFKQYYKLIFLGMLLGLFLSFLTPFITKSIVDIGIRDKDLSFINLMLLGQILTAVSSTILNLLRSWILLHMGWQMNFEAVSRFLSKVLKLPISFFDAARVGDLMQRIGDHGTLKMFVSASTFSVIFSVLNLLMFSVILAYYNVLIFGIFMVSSVFYYLWVRMFMNKRKTYNYRLFDINAKNQNKLLQLFSGIKDIKLNNYERQSRETWEELQAENFKVNAKQMAVNQYQQVGSFAIDMCKNIMITYFTARLVINGQMTLGMMLSVQYILGQLSAPITQFIGFNNSLQDAKIAVDRINEIYDFREEVVQKIPVHLTCSGDINFKDVKFKYGQSNKKYVLEDLNLMIPFGKTTAIIGESGSGKSTVLKMLLKFYEPDGGKITIGEHLLEEISTEKWRENCSSLLQDSFIFSQTLQDNIAYGHDIVDLQHLEKAAKSANIHQHIMSLPEGYFTTIGTEINAFSQGQKQRLLIARALYKSADYLFLDEPTASLDVKNEKIIMTNIMENYKGKTIVIVAHRLSTISNADHIILMEKGRVIEQGTHNELLAKGGKYENIMQEYKID